MRSVIASDLVVHGDLESLGDLYIDGMVAGNVVARGLVVGGRGHVEGRLWATTLVIHGTVSGEITALAVTLGSTARVVGKVFHNQITVEPGAVHDGLKPWRPPNYFHDRSPLAAAER